MVFQPRLVVLDGEDIVGVFLFYEIAREVLLGMHCIGGQHLPDQV